jgi:hypothetical protein
MTPTVYAYLAFAGARSSRSEMRWMISVASFHS